MGSDRGFSDPRSPLSTWDDVSSMPDSVLRSYVAFTQLLQRIAVVANGADHPEAALQFSLDAICAVTGWPVGHVYRLSADGSRLLMPTGLWHLDDPSRFASFRRLTEATPMPPGIGLPGRILATGKPLWVMDVTADANFPRATMAVDIGVRAGFGFPVLVGQEVVAVLEFFAVEPMEPDERLLDVMAYVGTLLGRVIERERAAQQQAELLAQAEAARAEAERATRERREILAMVSHDLRTPLSGILLRAHILAREAPKVSTGERFRRHTEGILQQVERLQDMLRDLLDHAAIEAGRLTLSLAVQPIGPVITDALTVIEPLLDAKSLDVHVAVMDGLPEVCCDADRLQQVVINLLGNAIKFSPDGGCVQLAVGLETPDMIRITISDRGPGVPAALQADLFKPFAKGTEVAAGVGLGLAIAKGIVEAHRGRIWYETAPLGGCLFAFELPLVPPLPDA